MPNHMTDGEMGIGRNRSMFSDEHWTVIVKHLGLSRREAEIVQCVFDGTNNELGIARQLGISSHTVHTHFERMYRKLDVQDRVSMVLSVFNAYLFLKLHKPTNS